MTRYSACVVVAVGIDIVEIARIQRALTHPGFVFRLLTEAERAICTTPAQVAGRWAAKEAAIKCLQSKVGFRQIEILNGPTGAPGLTFIGVPETEGLVTHLTITHERSMAAAVVVLERR